MICVLLRHTKSSTIDKFQTEGRIGTQHSQRVCRNKHSVTSPFHFICEIQLHTNESHLKTSFARSKRALLPSGWMQRRSNRKPLFTYIADDKQIEFLSGLRLIVTHNSSSPTTERNITKREKQPSICRRRSINDTTFWCSLCGTLFDVRILWQYRNGMRSFGLM